jgi:MFS transporter, DHA2 family, multidrug resistance protein
MQLSQDPALGAVPIVGITGKPEVIGMSGKAVPTSRGAVGATGASPSKYMLFGLGLATWMEFYTYDGVNLVLPDMAGTLGLSQDEASWILTTYLSALLFGVPLSIWMAGHVGYLRYIIGSAVVFAAASVACALAPDLVTLLFWRAVQGFAGAGLTMWWRASVYMLMPLPERSGSMMRISVVLYSATAVGLIFCGYVTDNFGWRLIFLPNVLCAAVAVRLLLRYFPEVPRPVDVRATAVDRLGILLLGVALVSAQIVLSRGEIDDWFGSARIQLLTWTGLIALVLFAAWQLSARNTAPLLQLRLLADRDLQAAVALGLFAGIIFSGSIYALPQFLRNVFPHPLSATQTGRIMCVYAVTAAVIRPLVSLSIARFGQRKAMTFAFTMLVLSMLLFARLMTTGTPVTYYMLPLILYAFCLAPMLSAIASGTVSRLPLARQLDAVAIYMSFRQFGASFGVTLVTILLDWRETMHSSVLYEHLRGMAPPAAAWAWPVAGAGSGSRAQDWMAQAAQFATARGGYSPDQAQHMAVGMLSQEAARQAATLAYADAFLFMAGIGLLALCFVPLISPSRRAKQ